MMRTIFDFPDYKELIPILAIMLVVGNLIISLPFFLISRYTNGKKSFFKIFFRGVIGMLVGLVIYYFIHNAFWPQYKPYTTEIAEEFRMVARARMLRVVFYTLPLVTSIITNIIWLLVWNRTNNKAPHG
jgi:hypothetical protein